MKRVTPEAVVLAAGLGTRLRPLTEYLPKPAIPFLNRPILHWIFDQISRSGVERAFVNVHHLPDLVRSAALAYEGGLDVRFSPEEEILGTAGVFWPLRTEIQSDPFLVLNGDVHFLLDPMEPMRDLEDHSEAEVSLGVMPLSSGNPYTPLDVSEEGTLRGFGEGRHFFTGIYAARRSFLDGLPGPGFRDLVGGLLLPLMEAGKVRAVPIEGSWYDLGTPRSYLDATFELLSSSAKVPGSCLVSRSGYTCLLHASSEISERAEMKGPTVAGPGVRVDAGATLGGTVLLEGAHLREGEDAQDCIVHPKCRLFG